MTLDVAECPNDSYGFTTRRSDHVWAERIDLEDGIRSFLAEIDPDTGYLADTRG